VQVTGNRCAKYELSVTCILVMSHRCTYRCLFISPVVFVAIVFFQFIVSSSVPSVVKPQQTTVVFS